MEKILLLSPLVLGDDYHQNLKEIPIASFQGLSEIEWKIIAKNEIMSRLSFEQTMAIIDNTTIVIPELFNSIAHNIVLLDHQKINYFMKSGFAQANYISTTDLSSITPFIERLDWSNLTHLIKSNPNGFAKLDLPRKELNNIEVDKNFKVTDLITFWEDLNFYQQQVVLSNLGIISLHKDPLSLTAFFGPLYFDKFETKTNSHSPILVANYISYSNVVRSFGSFTNYPIKKIVTLDNSAWDREFNFDPISQTLFLGKFNDIKPNSTITSKEHTIFLHSALEAALMEVEYVYKNLEINKKIERDMLMAAGGYKKVKASDAYNLLLDYINKKLQTWSTRINVMITNLEEEYKDHAAVKDKLKNLVSLINGSGFLENMIEDFYKKRGDKIVIPSEDLKEWQLRMYVLIKPALYSKLFLKLADLFDKINPEYDGMSIDYKYIKFSADDFLHQLKELDDSATPAIDFYLDMAKYIHIKDPFAGGNELAVIFDERARLQFLTRNFDANRTIIVISDVDGAGKVISNLTLFNELGKLKVAGVEIINPLNFKFEDSILKSPENLILEDLHGYISHKDALAFQTKELNSLDDSFWSKIDAKFLTELFKKQDKKDFLNINGSSLYKISSSNLKSINSNVLVSFISITPDVSIRKIFTDNWNHLSFDQQDALVKAKISDFEYPKQIGNAFAGDLNVIQATLASGMGPVAQHYLDQGDEAMAAAAMAALQQSAAMAASAQAGEGSDVPQFKGVQWTTPTIKWSLVDLDNLLDMYSGTLGEAEESQVHEAFAQWGGASGLVFEEVEEDADADIVLGYAKMNTAQTGQVGYTQTVARAGAIEDARIYLQDASQTALSLGADGEWYYAGTDANLEQVLLHEIGQALGLDTNADADSVMFYKLNANNRQLNSTDQQGIQSLYKQKAIQSATQLTQAMASMGSHSASSSAGLYSAQAQNAISVTLAPGQ